MKTISLKLPDGLDAKLTAEARRRGATKSAIVREALEGLTTRGGIRPAPSVLDLARDLAGSVSGPTDLSCNPRHLKRYGR